MLSKYIRINQVILIGLLTLSCIIACYPAAFIVTHGIYIDGWPAAPTTVPDDIKRAWVSPQMWLQYLESGDVVNVVKVTLDMAYASSPVLPSGGLFWFYGTSVLWGLASAYIMNRPRVPLRDPSGIHGTARWASQREIAALDVGVEIGIDPETGHVVRVPVEGNLVTIAPPRSGKTSGLILPNLAYPDPGAFGGPVVVIDPKGDVVRAMRARREALGYTVRCLDPLGLAGGTDRWNPLRTRGPSDVLYLLSIAEALIPQAENASEAGQYFRNRSSILIASALQIAIHEGHHDTIRAARLLSDEVRFAERLRVRSDDLSRDALSILENPDDRGRGNIISTAQQAFRWALDTRMQHVVENHTFEMSDLASGTVDLFVVLPADDSKTIIAPYIRWLLSDLFEAVRSNTLAERLLVFIDEAAVLGNFDTIINAAGELPGHGASIWTFWQSRQQMIRTFGTAGADILLDTAEVTTLFNLSRARPDELARWSSALGTYTGYDETFSEDSTPNERKRSVRKHAVELVKPADLVPLTRNQSITFVNNKSATSYPLLLNRTYAHEDRRFRRLVTSNPPVGPTPRG